MDIIVTGDFNVVLNVKDKIGASPNLHPHATKQLNELCNAHNLKDIWREQHPTEFQFTWKCLKPKITLERLDYIMVSEPLCRLASGNIILPAFKTDHSFPQITLCKLERERGPGYWQLNTSHLRDETFTQEIQKIIETTSEKYTDIFFRWEYIKLQVWGFAIQYSARKCKSNRLRLQVLERKLKQIENELVVEAKQGKILLKPEMQIVNIQKEISEIMEKETNGARLHCKLNYFEGGEKSSKYFFSLEHHKSAKKAIRTLRCQDGTNIYDGEIILNKLVDFLELYTTNGSNPSAKYLEDIIIPEISQTNRDELEQPISLKEIKIAISQMKDNKCAGLDGFPQEFYETFYDSICHTLHSLYIRAINCGELNP